MTYLMSNEGVCRTALATPGLLKSREDNKTVEKTK